MWEVKFSPKKSDKHYMSRLTQTIISTTNSRFLAWDISTRFAICRDVAQAQWASGNVCGLNISPEVYEATVEKLKAKDAMERRRVALALEVDNKAWIKGFQEKDGYICLTTRITGSEAIVKIDARLFRAIHKIVQSPTLPYLIEAVPAEANILRAACNPNERMTETEAMQKLQAMKEEEKWWRCEGTKKIPLAAVCRLHPTRLYRILSLLYGLRTEKTHWEKFLETHPVEAFDLGDTYFVLDGSHRIDLAYLLGFEDLMINAKVYTIKECPNGYLGLGALTGYSTLLEEHLGLSDLRRRFINDHLHPLVLVADVFRDFCEYEGSDKRTEIRLKLPALPDIKELEIEDSQRPEFVYLSCLYGALTKQEFCPLSDLWENLKSQ
jgi:hypothetical protein